MRQAVPPAFYLHFPGSMAALDAECQALAAETARLRSAAVFLQAVHAEEAELLVGDLSFASERIEFAKRKQLPEDQLSRLKSLIPEKLWLNVQSAAVVMSHRWIRGQNAPPGYLGEKDYAPAWSHIVSWMGLPSPVAIRWGVTATDTEPLLQQLALCEARAGPAYHYITPEGDEIGDAHMAGPAYETALAAVMAGSAAEGHDSNGVGAAQPAYPAFVLAAGPAGPASPDIVYRYSARRLPLPVVVPLHMRQAHSTVMSFGGLFGGSAKECSYGLPLPKHVCGFEGCEKPSKYKVISICTACRLVRYCDVGCQTAAWKGHKGACVAAVKAASAKDAAASMEAADAAATSSANAFVSQHPGVTLGIPPFKGLIRDHFKLTSALPPPVRGAPWTAAESALMKAQQTLLVEEYMALGNQAIANAAQTVVMSLRFALNQTGITHPMMGNWTDQCLRSGGLSPPSRPASVSTLGGLKQAHAATTMMVILGLLPRDATGQFGGPSVGPRGPKAEDHPMWTKEAAPLGQPLGIYTAARAELEAEAQRRTAGAVPVGFVRLYRNVIMEGVEADVPGNFVDVPSSAALPNEPRFRVYAHGTGDPVVSSAAGPLTHALTRVWDLDGSRQRKAAWGTLHNRLSLPARQLVFAYAGATKEELPEYQSPLVRMHGGQFCLPECAKAGKLRASLAQDYGSENYPVPILFTRHVLPLPYDVVQAAMIEGREDAAGSSRDVIMAGGDGGEPAREYNLPRGARVTVNWSTQLASIVCADAEAGGGLEMGPGHVAPDATGKAYAQQALVMRIPASFHLGAGLSLHSITRLAYGAEYSVRWDPYSPRAGLRVQPAEVTYPGCVQLAANAQMVRWQPHDLRGASIVLSAPILSAAACGVDGKARPLLSSHYILQLAAQATFERIRHIKEFLKNHNESIAAGLAKGAQEVAEGKVPDFPRRQEQWPAKAAQLEGEGVEAVQSIDPREVSPLLTGFVQLMKADGKHLRLAKAPLGWRELIVFNGGEGHLRGIWPAAFMYEPLAGPNVYQPWGTTPTDNPTMFQRFHGECAHPRLARQSALPHVRPPPPSLCRHAAPGGRWRQDHGKGADRRATCLPANHGRRRARRSAGGVRAAHGDDGGAVGARGHDADAVCGDAQPACWPGVP